MLKKFKFNIDEKFIALYTDIDSISSKLLNDQKQILKTIPCTISYIGEFNDVNEIDNYITVLNAENRKMEVNKEDNIIKMTSKAEDFRFPDLLYSILGMLSNMLKKYDTFLLHSAAVTNDLKKTMLIMGDPGSGKSTIAFHLMRNYNYKLLSNDITVIKKENDKVRVIAGTTHMQMRLGAIKLYYPDILDKINVKDSSKNEWDIKPYVNDVINDKIYDGNDTYINQVCHITTAQNLDFSIRIDDYVDNYLYIYEQLIRQIRNTRNLIVGYNYPLESFEDEKANRKIVELSQFIASNINIYDVRGSIEEVSKQLVYRNEE